MIAGVIASVVMVLFATALMVCISILFWEKKSIDLQPDYWWEWIPDILMYIIMLIILWVIPVGLVVYSWL